MLEEGDTFDMETSSRMAFRRRLSPTVQAKKRKGKKSHSNQQLLNSTCLEGVKTLESL